MKKVLAFIAIIIVIFLLLTYWSVSSTSKEFKTGTIVNLDDLEKTDFRQHDSLWIAASTLYKGDILKEIMQGENYREAWSTPVKVPVVYLDTLAGGLKVIKEGGGKQTHSLKLKNEDNILYTLRSVTKDPQKLIPEIAETLGLENIIVDGISAQHPYGAILAAELAETAGVFHTHPQLVFVPKQKRLEGYNKKYGNRLYLLEFETESEKNWTSLKNIQGIVETNKLQELKMKYGDLLSIDRSALIKARLFDMLIGDWDRHAEQWGWALQEKKDQTGVIAIPIAGDRDNAFFNIDGIIPSIVTNKNVEPLVRPFEEKIDYLPGLVYPFDRYFLINTPKNIFLEQAVELQNSLTDEKIASAFKVWPEEISKLDKEQIIQKIKSRRQSLTEYAGKFHEIIQEKGILTEALKGSEDLNLEGPMLECFECGSPH